MRKLIVLAILMLSSAAFAQTNTNVMSRIRDATDQSQVAAVNVGSAAITATTSALTTRSEMYCYDSTADNRWERVDLGTGVNAAGMRIAPPTDARFQCSDDANVNAVDNPMFFEISDGTHAALFNTTYPGYLRLQDGDSTELADVLASIADAVALTNNALVTFSMMGLYNGASMDMARSGASGGVLVEVVTRAWEDLANGWINVKKSATGTYAPAKTSTANIGAAATVVLASVEIIGYPNCTITLRNTDAADPFVDAAIYVSPDNAGTCGDANWASLTWTACDGLTATNTCVYALSMNSYRYVCAKVTGAAGNEVSVDAWLTCNIN